MKLNNSIKLAIANFALFWKIFLYKIIAFGVSILLVLPVLSIVLNCFRTAGFNAMIGDLFLTPAFQNLPRLITLLLQIFNAFFSGVSILASQNVFALIYLSIIVLIVMPFLLKLSDIPASESAYSYMSSLNKNSFTINFVNMLPRSMNYSLIRSLLEIPYLFVIGLGSYGILRLGTVSEVMAIISPFLLFVFVVLMLALLNAILNGWAPSIVVFNCCAVKGFNKGLKSISRNFFSILSSFSIVMSIVVCLLYLFGVYAMIFAVPFVSLVNAVFGQVLFFESQGMDYYVSPDVIIKPRKLECADDIYKVKNII